VSARDEILGRVRASVGDRPVVERREAPTPEALLAEVRHVYRTEGPADLAGLEPHYIRPTDARLPEQPLRTAKYSVEILSTTRGTL